MYQLREDLSYPIQMNFKAQLEWKFWRLILLNFIKNPY